jgi:hypothetical protein
VVKVGCEILVRHMLCRFNQLCQDALLQHHALAAFRWRRGVCGGTISRSTQVVVACCGG